MISFNFRLIYGLRVLQKSIKIGPSDCIQMSETSELPGAPPLDTLRVFARGPHQGPYGGPLDPTFCFAHYALTFFSAPTSKYVLQALYRYPFLCTWLILTPLILPHLKKKKSFMFIWLTAAYTGKFEHPLPLTVQTQKTV